MNLYHLSPALVEGASSALITGLGLTFAAPGSALLVVTAVATQLIASNALRFLAKNTESQTMILASKVAPPFFFQATIGSFLNIITHELGHAVTASLLFQNCHPTIYLDLLAGNGKTSYSHPVPNHFGAFFGKNCAVITTLMGPLSAIITAVICIAIAKIGPKKCRPYLLLIASTIFFYHGRYAFSAIVSKSPSHDFVFLKDAIGLPPIPTAIILLQTGVYAQTLFLKEEECQVF